MSEGDTYRKRDKHERTQVEVVHVIRTKSRLDVVSELSATKRSVWLTVNHTALNLSRTASALGPFVQNPAKRLTSRRVMLWHYTTWTGNQRLATWWCQSLSQVDSRGAAG
jgi:hypothetical protein